MKHLKYISLFAFITLPSFFFAWVLGLFNTTYEVSVDLKSDYSGVMKTQIFYVMDGINQGYSEQYSKLKSINLSKDEFSHLEFRLGHADRALKMLRLDLGDRPFGRVAVSNLKVGGYSTHSIKDTNQFYYNDLKIEYTSLDSDEVVFQVIGRDPYISSKGPVIDSAESASLVTAARQDACLKLLVFLIVSEAIFASISYLFMFRKCSAPLSVHKVTRILPPCNVRFYCKIKYWFGQISVLAVIFYLLVFRNTGIFIAPAPVSEDFAVFLAQEYEIGFPDTAFVQYSGYIHLLPRIIAWMAMKADLSNAMMVMNWSVLFFKIITFYLIFRSKEISSCLIKFSLLAYLVLFPFPDETYNNVTNLQWWLIPLMAIIIISSFRNVFAFVLSIYCLILAGFTGVNSILFAIPCAYLMFRERNTECVIKCMTVIICAAVQFLYLYQSGRSGIGQTIQINSGLLINLIQLFVNRAVYHTLFDFYSENWHVSILIFIMYMLVLFFNFYYYRKNVIVYFMLLFWGMYTATILYRFSADSSINSFIYSLSGERYFIISCTYSFIILISSLNILYRFLFKNRNYRRLMTYSCFLILIVIAKNYSVYFPASNLPESAVTAYQYYEDAERFKTAEVGETINFHFYFSWTDFCKISNSPWICSLTKK